MAVATAVAVTAALAGKVTMTAAVTAASAVAVAATASAETAVCGDIRKNGAGGLNQALGSLRGSGVPGDGGGDGAGVDLFSGGRTPTNDFLAYSQVMWWEYDVRPDISRILQHSVE